MCFILRYIKGRVRYYKVITNIRIFIDFLKSIFLLQQTITATATDVTRLHDRCNTLFLQITIENVLSLLNFK